MYWREQDPTLHASFLGEHDQKESGKMVMAKYHDTVTTRAVQLAVIVPIVCHLESSVGMCRNTAE